MARHPHRSQPAHVTQSAPDVTGTISKPAASDEAEALVPYYLPNVPRSRMRSCGETWHSMKMSGGTGDDDWRDFAKKCLATAQ